MPPNASNPAVNGQLSDADDAARSRKGLFIAGAMVLVLGSIALLQTAQQLSSSLEGLSRPLGAQPETLADVSGPYVAPMEDLRLDASQMVHRLPLQVFGLSEASATNAQLYAVSSDSSVLPDVSLAISGELLTGPALLVDLSAAKPGQTIITLSLRTASGQRADESFRLTIAPSGKFNSLPEAQIHSQLPALQLFAANGTRICGVASGQSFVSCWADALPPGPAEAPPGVSQKPRQIALDQQLCTVAARDSTLSCEGQSYSLPGDARIDQFAVASHARHLCVLSTAGAAWCTGDNSAGALGTGSVDSAEALMPVLAGQGPANDQGQLFDLRQIAVGRNFTCAITRAGAPLCWGSNAQGQLSHPPSPSIAVPRQVARQAGLGSGNVSQIAAGRDHACALTRLSELYCWGSNAHGQLGRDATPGQPDHRPVLVQLAEPTTGDTPARIADLQAAGDATCVLLTNGSIQCWGQLDAETPPFGAAPRQVVPAARAFSMSVDAQRLSWLTPVE